MVPSAYSNYFATMAAVAATLFGLIFLAVSIAPGSSGAGNMELERRLKATAAYLALSNPLIVSLLALIPNQELGLAVTAVAGSGLLDMLAMGLRLFRSPVERPLTVRNSLFILVGLGLYGLELRDGVQLLQAPADVSALNGLAPVLIFIIVYGVACAWELVGGHRFPLRDLLTSPLTGRDSDAPAHKDHGGTGKPG